jgi:hypothetical protein
MYWKVITAGKGGDPDFGERLAALSKAGTNIVAEGSGHYVQIDRPDLVIAAMSRCLSCPRSGAVSTAE